MIDFVLTQLFPPIRLRKILVIAAIIKLINVVLGIFVSLVSGLLLSPSLEGFVRLIDHVLGTAPWVGIAMLCLFAAHKLSTPENPEGAFE